MSRRARLLILCPGQGGQHGGMFELARSHPDACMLLDECGLTVDAGAGFSNRVAQPTIVAATLAMWQAVRGFAPMPALVAGYSIGELAAHSVAGALTPLDAIALAHARAQTMDACLASGPEQALVAIAALPLAHIAQLIDDTAFAIAIETSEDSCIAGGYAAHLPALTEKINAAGGRIQRLAVEIASHTRHMAQAVAPFSELLRASHFQPQTAPLLSGISATTIDGKAQAVEHLSRQLAQKIRWMDCMDAASELAVTVALELGPGQALSRMLQARHPGIDSRSVADFRSLAGIEKWLGRHFD